MGQGVGDSQSALEADLQPPGAQNEMSDVVQSQKDSHHCHRVTAKPERGECNERAKGQPACPDEPVADTAKRTTESGPESFYHRRRNAIQLRARQRSHGNACEIGMGVEVPCVSAERFL